VLLKGQKSQPGSKHPQFWHRTTAGTTFAMLSPPKNCCKKDPEKLRNLCFFTLNPEVGGGTKCSIFKTILSAMFAIIEDF